MSDDQPDASELRARFFDDMAAQIRLNKGAKFGGAYVLLPPMDGDPISSLMLNQEELAIFWSSLQTIADMAVEALNSKPKQQGFGRR
jgi:hypothetical protein